MADIEKDAEIPSKEKDKWLIIILGGSAIATISVDFLIHLYEQQLWLFAKPLIAIFDALVSGVVITSLFTTLEKLNVLLPIQRRIANLLDKLRERLDAQISFVDGVARYRTARDLYGLSNVVGLKATGSPHIGIGLEPRRGPKFLGDNVAELVLRELVRRKDKRAELVVSYMNTFMEQSDELTDLLYDAVLSGLHVQILILHPENEALKTRYEDAYQKLTRFNDPKLFVGVAIEASNQLQAIQSKIKDQQSVFPGTIEIRYQRDLGMNYPLLLISERRSDGQLHHIKAYTGFYGTLSSERLPYIEWSNSDLGVIEWLAETFVQKWPFADETLNLKAPAGDGGDSPEFFASK